MSFKQWLKPSRIAQLFPEDIVEEYQDKKKLKIKTAIAEGAMYRRSLNPAKHN